MSTVTVSHGRSIGTGSVADLTAFLDVRSDPRVREGGQPEGVGHAGAPGSYRELDVLAEVHRALDGFLKDLYRGRLDNGRPFTADRLPAMTIADLVGFVTGVGCLGDVLRVFSISEPRYSGLYFPAARADEVPRWGPAANRAVERLMELKLLLGATRSDTTPAAADAS